MNWNEYKQVQSGQRSRLQSYLYNNQATLYDVTMMGKKCNMETRCVYNWANMMVDMGLDKIVHHYMAPRHSRIFNAWIEGWESDILITRYQENEHRLLKKYRNLRFLDDEDNQTHTISQENLECKGPTRRNKQYCVVGNPLN